MNTPVIDPAVRKRVSPASSADGATRELFQSLLCRLPLRDGDGRPALRTLGLTSCAGGAGVSTLAAQLSVEASLSGLGPVVLVDANMTRPCAHKLLGLKAAPGLAEAFAEETALEDVLQPSSWPQLSLLAAGRGDGVLACDLAGPGIASLLDRLKEAFSLVIVDLPALARLDLSAERLCGAVDGLALVLEAEGTPLARVRQTTEWLGSRARFLGVILNKRREYMPDWLQRLL